MNDMTERTPSKLPEIQGILSSVTNWTDQALLIEKEIGMSNIYALIANGYTDEDVAEFLGMTMDQTQFILKRTPKYRKEYMNAKAFHQAEGSMDMLDNFKYEDKLGKKQAAASRHHNTMVDRATGILNKSEEAKGLEQIVVNNTVVVRDNHDTAPIPDELKDILEGEFENVGT